MASWTKAMMFSRLRLTVAPRGKLPGEPNDLGGPTGLLGRLVQHASQKSGLLVRAVAQNVQAAWNVGQLAVSG